MVAVLQIWVIKDIKPSNTRTFSCRTYTLFITWICVQVNKWITTILVYPLTDEFFCPLCTYTDTVSICLPDWDAPQHTRRWHKHSHFRFDGNPSNTESLISDSIPKKSLLLLAEPRFVQMYIWLVVWNICFPYIGNNHSNWLIYFRGGETTNQIWFDYISFYLNIHITFQI